MTATSDVICSEGIKIKQLIDVIADVNFFITSKHGSLTWQNHTRIIILNDALWNTSNIHCLSYK